MTADQAATEKAYNDTAEDIIALCDTIRECYSSTPRNLNWGHVGTANHVANLLSEILDFIGNRHD